MEIVVDFAKATLVKGVGYTANFDTRTCSVKFKTVNSASLAYCAGLRKGDVLAWVGEPEESLKRTKEDKARLDALAQQCLASQLPLRLGVLRKAHTPKAPLKERQEQRKEVWRESQSRVREAETPEQRSRRLSLQSEANSSARSHETPEQRSRRLQLDVQTHSSNRSQETPEQRSRRLQLDVQTHSSNRSQETPEQQSRRLEQDSQAHSAARASETPAARSSRRSCDRTRKQTRRLMETEEEKEERRAADRLHKAAAKEALSAEEHLAFVADQAAYLRKWRRRQSQTEEGKARLEAYRDYWRRYWEALSDEEWAVKRETDRTRKAAARACASDLKKEVAAFRRYAARKRKLAMETADEKQARLHAEDLRRLLREKEKGLQVADVEGLADHLKAQRLQRARVAGLRALKARLAAADEPGTAEETRKREEDLRDYFAGLVADSPTRTCLSCKQLFFDYQVQAFAPRCLEKLAEQESRVRDKVAVLRRAMTEPNKVKTQENIALLNTFFLATADVRQAYAEAKVGASEHPRLFGHPDKPSVQVCKRCWGCLKTGMAPKCGSWNSLKAVPQPPSVAKLGDLEAHLIALRQPFMKIASLPRGGQKGVTGGVINVPADVEGTMARLMPLNLEEGRLIAVQLKKRLMYRTVDQSQLVCPSRMVAALVELKEGNRHYAEVEIRDAAAWEAEVAEESPEFADALVQPADQPAPDPVDPGSVDDDDDWAEEDDEELELELGSDGKALPVRSVVDCALLPVDGARIGDINKIAKAQSQQRKTVVVAPSEGQRPLPLFLDPEVEEMAFPTLFPTATNSAKTERLLPVTLGEYLKNRLTLADRRFVSSKPFLFFSLYRLEYERLLSSISISLNKATMENRFGAELKNVDFHNDDFVEQFVASDGGYRWMKQSRGSPAFWKTCLLDITAMCRQLGPPTLFLTLSADDRHWPETMGPIFELEYKRTPSEEDLANLSDRQRNHLLRKYPDVAARLFSHRVQVFFHKMLGKDGVNPLGRKVVDFFHRFEWQQRGSPHTHALLWLEDAPVLGRDPEEDIVELADKLIRTDVPDEEEDPELHYLVKSKQTHRHTPSCQKREKPRFKLSAEEQAKMDPLDLKRKKEDALCRFDYERPPVEATRLDHNLQRVLRPKADSETDTSSGSSRTASPIGSSMDWEEEGLDAELSEAAMLDALGGPSSFDDSASSSPASSPLPELRRIRSLLREDEPAPLRRMRSLAAEAEGLDEAFLADATLDDSAAAAARSTEADFQSSPIRLEMRRRKEDGYTNNFNSAILRIWGANMDLQFVTNTFAACQYICSYVAKSEKELGETMTEVLRSMPDGTAPVQRLRKIANAFMGARSVSAQEAIHRILGLPMLEKSRQVKFVASGYPKNRHRMLKPRAARAQLDKEHTTVEELFQDGPIEKYQMRDCSEPAVAALSLADFCAWYEGNGQRGGYSGGDDEAEDDGELVDDLTSAAVSAAKQPSSSAASPMETDSPAGSRTASPMDTGSQGPASPARSAASASTQASSIRGPDLPETVTLKSPDGQQTLDVLQKRRRKRIIRFYGFNREGQEEESAYSRLVLFKPFRNEAADMDLAASSHRAYTDWLWAEWKELEPKVLEYDSYAAILTRSYEEMTKQRQERLERELAGADEDGGDDDDEEQDGVEDLLDPEDLQLDVLDGIAPDATSSGPVTPFTVTSGFKGAKKEELVAQLKDLEAKMNADQRTAFTAACRQIRAYKAAQADGRRYRGAPIFISGPGGTGKSFLLKALRLKIHLELHEDLEDLTSVVLAPTGCAALNVDGDTLHHGLSLPIQQDFATVDRGLTARKLQVLRNMYEKTHAFLFDEASMISSNQLYQVDGRLRALTGVVEPDVHFGGLLTFWFGDLCQLPPVAAPRPYANASTKVVGAAAAGVHLWRDLMLLQELTIVERQKDDEPFAELLDRLRVAKPTDDDLKVLKSRVMGRPGPLEKAAEDPGVRDSVYLFPTNKRVDQHNDDRRDKLLAEVKAEAVATGKDPESSKLHLLVTAQDDFDKESKLSRDSYEGNFQALVPKSKDRTGGLPSSIHLLRGLRVMLRKNLGVHDGLVNGSCGTVEHWSASGGVVFVRFDRVRGRLVGQERRNNFPQYIKGHIAEDKGLVPIVFEEATFKAAKGSYTLCRRMLPLVMCWATTIHKAQGMSLERVVTDLTVGMKPAAAYVALSRVTKLSGLFLLSFSAGAIKADLTATMEYDRLRKHRLDLHRTACDCPKDAPCRLEVAYAASKPLSTAKASALDAAFKPCGSGTHGVLSRSPKEKALRALKKALVPGKVQSRADKKKGHVDGTCALSQADVLEFANSFAPIFTGSQRKFSKAHFRDRKMSELRGQLLSRPHGFIRLVQFFRDAKMVPLECKKRSLHVDGSYQRLLYSCLQTQMLPVSVASDGNCLFHAVAALVFGMTDGRRHEKARAVSLAFLLLFKDHVQALILADNPGSGWGAAEVEAEYVNVCWDAFRLKTWGTKWSLYALSWVLGRPVHLYSSCFHWSAAEADFDAARPRGGVRLDQDLPALRTAFAEQGTGDSELPSFVEYAALDTAAQRLPLTLFLERNHYLPLLLRKATRRQDLVQPALKCWRDSLPHVRQAHPLPKDQAQLRDFFQTS